MSNKKSYVERLWWMKKEIINDIKLLIENNGGEIKIPYYYDEDEINDDIETLIEDEFDVRVGDSYNNMTTTISGYDCIKDVEIVAFTINNKTSLVELITSDSNVYELNDINNIQSLALIYDVLLSNF